MTLRPKFSLRIAGGDNGWAPPHAAQGGCGFRAQFPGLGHQQIGDLMGFEMTPHILDWIEFRRVGRQAFHNDAPSRRNDVVLDQEAAMHRHPIPKDHYFAGKMPLQVPQKLDDLEALNAALVNLKIEPPQRQAANDRKTFPVEGFLEDGRLSARRPGADSRRACAQPAFIYENDGSPLSAGFFLNPATLPAASGGWPSGHVPPPGARASGN